MKLNPTFHWHCVPDIYCLLVSMLMDYGPTKPNGQYRIHCFWGNIKFYLFGYSNQTWVCYQELVCLNLNCPVIYCSDCVYTTDSLCCCFHTTGSLHWGGDDLCTDRCFEVAPDIKGLADAVMWVRPLERGSKTCHSVMLPDFRIHNHSGSYTLS